MLTELNFRTRWVGGYFGGLLAKAYAESDQFEIVFIARGETKKQLQSQD
jgi:hypothetical protein